MLIPKSFKISDNWTEEENRFAVEALEQEYLSGDRVLSIEQLEAIEASWNETSLQERARKLMIEHFGIWDHKTMPKKHLFPLLAIGAFNNSFIPAVKLKLAEDCC